MPTTMRLLAGSAMVLAVVVEAAQRYAAVSAIPNELIPRYLVDKTFPLAKRIGGCNEGHHPCDETGNSDQCCPNDTYCYVSSDGDPRCCPIGSNCVDDTDCSSDAYFCTETITESGSAVAREGCCPRRCPATSQYLCPRDAGGNCCPYDSECRAGNCVSTVRHEPTNLLTPVEEGCTTSQYPCEDGPGCCDNDQSCTEVSGTGYCAPGRPTETDGLDYIDDDESSGGLSDGAKAGISVGAVVGAAAIIGLLAWLCIYKRRERRRQSAITQLSSDGDVPMHEGAPGVAAATEGSSQQQSLRPPQPSDGLTQDYFGPPPAAGPFTETPAPDPVAPSPGAYRAVPSHPEQPGDIAAPVELDSAVSPNREHHASPLGPPQQPQQPETSDGRFELYGSPGTEPLSGSSRWSIAPTPIEYRPRKEEKG